MSSILKKFFLRSKIRLLDSGLLVGVVSTAIAMLVARAHEALESGRVVIQDDSISDDACNSWFFLLIAKHAVRSRHHHLCNSPDDQESTDLEFSDDLRIIQPVRT